VILDFAFFTGDAHGMNMIVKAANRACAWLMEHSAARRFYIFSGFEAEKKSAGNLLRGEAHGMNMIVKAANRACAWLMEHSAARRFYIFSGFEAEKKSAGNLLRG